MKNLCCILSGLSFLVLLGACHSGGQKQSDAADSTVVKMHVQVSDAMAVKIDTFLSAYYKLKNAFVDTDSTLADKTAISFQQKLMTLPLDELKPDSKKYNRAYAASESLKAEIAGLLGEKSMEGKRLEFQMISDITYDLIKTIGMKNKTVYRAFCPMANDGKGAYWLSNSKTIRNPYYGHNMINCGIVKETLEF